MITKDVKGTVIKYDTKLGYGFIKANGLSYDDIHIHWKEVEPEKGGFKKLNSGDSVRFDITKTGKGLQARNLVIEQSIYQER